MHRSSSLSIRALTGASAFLLDTVVVSASPSLDIRTGPGGITSIAPAGPAFDPFATAGQWFAPRESGVPSPRSHEFYDNTARAGGGSASSTAIRGDVTGFSFSPAGGITGLTIRATVTNDAPSGTPWLGGGNSHGETRPYTGEEQYVGTLFEPVIVAEFAYAVAPGFPVTGGPYTGPEALPYAPFSFVAMNHNLFAWYSFAPGIGSDEFDGAFQVPSWQLPDIPLGGSASVDMVFAIHVAGAPGEIPPSDPFFATLQFFASEYEMLSNRTTSLKVSQWLETLSPDDGMDYLTPLPFSSSDASVFHNIPEPSTYAAWAGLAVVGLALWRRRKSSSSL